MLKVGLAEQSTHIRYAPTAMIQASYLTAVATGMDSFWIPDHLNAAASVPFTKILRGLRKL